MSDRTPWLERAGSVNRIIGALLGLCALVVVADLFYEKLGHYPFETWFGFHAGYGFVSCVVLVLAAAQMRRVLMRDENLYGDAADQYTNPDGEADG